MRWLLWIGVAVACVLAGFAGGALVMTRIVEYERTRLVPVCVARQDCPQFTRLDDPASLFEYKMVPNAEVRGGMALSLDELQGRVLLGTLQAGDQVAFQDLASRDSRPVRRVPFPGRKRGVTVRIDADVALRNALTPGGHVDVLVQRGVKQAKPEPLLQNIPVCTLDVQGRSTSVTLDVTPDQALALISAKETGTIILQPR